MKVTAVEQNAIRTVLEAGKCFGYGNLISHLQTAWARDLMRQHNMNETGARRAAGGKGYPFGMQDDIVERGEWDQTGERYKKQPTAKN